MAREPVAVLTPGHIGQFKGDGGHRLGDVELHLTCRSVDGGVRVDWSVRNPCDDSVVLDRVGVRLATRPDRVLEHGWQSWSVVRRCAPDDVVPGRARAPQWRRAMFGADPDAAGRVVAGDHFLVDDGGVTGFLSADDGFGTVTVAAPTRRAHDGLEVWALLDGVELAAGQERRLDPFWTAAGDPGPLYSRYVELWAVESAARASAPSRPGWCSWYQHWSGVTPADVRAAAETGRSHGLEIIQIDDGYQAAIGEWRRPAPAWDGALDQVVGAVRTAGMEPGLWTAPFLAGAGTAVARHHPDWLVRDSRGRAVGAMNHPWLWGGWARALDTTHPGVLDHLRETFAGLVEDGFRYHKLDFLYGAALTGRRHDRGASRAQALRRGLEAVRQATGPDAFLLACGCPLGPAVGVVDAMRVSTDVGPRWSAPGSIPGYAETESGLRNSVRASVLRAPMHRRLWINDPDCLILRPVDTRLSAHHRRVMADVVAGTGAFLMLSDDLSTYGRCEWETLDELRRWRGADAPLDLLDPFAAAPTVRSPVSELEVDWRGDGHTRLTGPSG